MNPITGEIKPLNEFKENEPRIEIEGPPNPNCPKCGGTGRRQVGQRRPRYRPCKCTRKKRGTITANPPEEKAMTKEDLQNAYNKRKNYE